MTIEDQLQNVTPEPSEPIPEPKQEEKPIEPISFNESMSDEIGELAGALAKAQGEMNNGAKDKQGYGYKYMTLGVLCDIARPALAKHDVAIIQTHQFIKGKVPSVVTHTTIMHSSGQWHKSSLELPIKPMPQLSPSQCIGSIITYGRRYTLQSLCLVAAEDDTDGV